MNSERGIPTFACVLTPEGRGAVAVVRVAGPDALAIADRCFRPARPPGLAQTRMGRLRVGRLGAGPGDEVVAVPLGGSPPAVEIHTHGGALAARLVLEALAAEGATVVSQSAWAHRTAPSRLAAEAALALAEAPTLRASEHLLAQFQGALEQKVRVIAAALTTDSSFALASLDALIASAPVGLRLVSGWKVVLAGRPNVGKSRLFNALAGFDRAIVADTPGTTRDVVSMRTAVGGWPVELADTAGLREPADAIEASGVSRARAQHREADLVLLVLDGSEALTDDDTRLLASHPSALRVVNKADLPSAWSLPEPGWIHVSAERGDGLPALLSEIASRLVPSLPDPGAPLPFLPRHLRMLVHARDWLNAGKPDAAAAALGRLIGAAEQVSPGERAGVRPPAAVDSCVRKS